MKLFYTGPLVHAEMLTRNQDSHVPLFRRSPKVKFPMGFVVLVPSPHGFVAALQVELFCLDVLHVSIAKRHVEFALMAFEDF